MYYIFETVVRNISLWAFVTIAAISALVCAAVMLAPESYSEDGEVSAEDTRPAGSPAYGQAAPPRLLD